MTFRAATIFLHLIFLSSFTSYSQDTLQKHYANIFKAKYDSIFYDPYLVELRNQVKNKRAKSRNYNTFNINYRVSNADIKDLNTDLEALDGRRFNSVFHGFGFSTTKLNKRRTTDFALWFLLPKKLKVNPEYRLMSSGFNLDKGYMVINRDNIKLYPFLGIGWSSLTLRSYIDSATTITSGLIGYSSDTHYSSLSRNIWSAYTGAEFNFRLKYNSSNFSGSYLGLRFSYALPVFYGKFDYVKNLNNYKPDIFIARTNIDLFIKFFWLRL